MLSSGDFVATSGIYKPVGVLGDEQPLTLVYGDSAPLHRGEKVRYKLVLAAKHPIRG